MDWYEPDVRELEKVIKTAARPPDPVVFYGSSTIRLWNNLAEDLASPRALNLGFGGSTLEACAHFFERLIPTVKPCSLVIYAGDNDLGDGRSPQEVLKFFRSLASQVDRALNGIAFGFISIKPSPARFGIIDRIRAANLAVRREIESRPRGYFIDVFPAMLKPDGGPQTKFFNDDGLHMNRNGYELWIKLLSPYRNQMFTKDCPERKPDRVPSDVE